MSEAKATALISVLADTSQAVKEMTKFLDSQKKIEEQTKKSSGAISQFVSGAAEGLSKFNLAVGGIEKAFGLLKGAMDTAFEVNRRDQMEKMLPTGAVGRLSAATDHLISRQDTLRLSVRGMTGDFKINEQQMAKVLEASVAFAQKGLGPASEIADKLLDGIAGKTRFLDDLGIAFKTTGTAAGDATELFAKMDAAINDPNNAVDQRTKELAALKDEMEQITLAIEKMIAAAGRGIAAAARYATELGQNIGDFFSDQSGNFLGSDQSSGATAIDKQRIRNERRDSLFGYRFGEKLLGRAGAAIASGRQDRDYWANMSDEDYANTFGLQTPGNLVDRYGTVGHKYDKKDKTDYTALWATQHKYDYLIGGGAEGTLGISQGSVGQVRPLDVVIMGIGKQGSFTLLDRAGVASQGDLLSRADSGSLASRGSRGLSQLRYGGESFSGNATLAGIANGGWANETSGLLKEDSFSAMAAGINAAVLAAVDGSDAIGKASAKASATVLKSLAVEAVGRMAFEGALAIGALAMGDLKGAGLHGAAAAKYGIAAALMGSLGAGLGAVASGGGGASASAGPAGGGFASATGGASSGNGPISVVVNVGYGFDGNSKQIEESVRRGVRAAQLKGGRSNYATEVSG